MSAGMVDVGPVLLRDTDAAVAVADTCAVRHVALHVLVAHVEFEGAEARNLEIGGSSAVGHLDAAVVDGDLHPVAHQTARAAGFGVVDEGQEVGTWLVGAEEAGPDARRSGGGLGLMGGLVRAADAGVEA